MKSVMIAAVVFFTVTAGTAYAEGEGNGDPFPNRSPGITVSPAAIRTGIPHLTTASSGAADHARHGIGALFSRHPS